MYTNPQTLSLTRVEGSKKVTMWRRELEEGKDE